MRSIVAALLAIMMMGAPALAQGDDPAVAACEAVARVEAEHAATSYRRIAGTIEGRRAIIKYEVRGKDGAAAQRLVRCAFAFNPTTGQWKFDQTATAHASLCRTIADSAADHIRTGAMDRARRLRPNLEKCQPVLKTELLRQSRLALAAIQLLQTGFYPIDQAATALRPSP